MSHPNLIERINAVDYDTFNTLADGVPETKLIGIVVPRGAKATLRKIKGSVRMDASTTAGEQFIDAFITGGGRPTFIDPTGSGEIGNTSIEAAEPIWSWQAGFLVRVATAVAIAHSPMPSELLDLDLSEDDHPNLQLVSRGAQSNSDIGWWYTVVATNALNQTESHLLSLRIDLEWLETSRSTSATWTMDQMTEEESQ